MFDTAKSLQKATPAKKTRETVDMAGVRDIAILTAMIKSAETMLKTLEGELKDDGFAHFMTLKGSTRPSSFSAVEGPATCSVELRKRSSASALTEDEAKVLRDAGLEPEKVDITPELFAINPKYNGDMTLLGKVERALSGKVPEDFIVKQDGTTKLVVSDTMLDTAFHQAGTDAVLKIMTTMALKPKLGPDYDMSQLIGDAIRIMNPDKVVMNKPVETAPAPAPAKRTRKAA